MQGLPNMGFNLFQKANAKLKKITEDGNGDETTSLSFSVKIDPMFGRKRFTTPEGVEIEGMETVISFDSRIDAGHNKWKLEYDDNTYLIVNILPVPKIGSTDISHYEVQLK